MKITKGQLRRIIKEEISRSILVEKKKKSPKKRYAKKVEKRYDKTDSHSDVVDEIFIDLCKILGDWDRVLKGEDPVHPLTAQINQMTDEDSPDYDDVLDVIEDAVDDGTVSADIYKKLLKRI